MMIAYGLLSAAGLIAVVLSASLGSREIANYVFVLGACDFVVAFAMLLWESAKRTV
jgi:hypothetical protein